MDEWWTGIKREEEEEEEEEEEGFPYIPGSYEVRADIQQESKQ